MFSGYKTVFVNGVAVVFVVLAYLFPEADVPGQAEAGEQAGRIFDLSNELWLAILALGNIVLRAVTSTAVFWKKS